VADFATMQNYRLHLIRAQYIVPVILFYFITFYTIRIQTSFIYTVHYVKCIKNFQKKLTRSSSWLKMNSITTSSSNPSNCVTWRVTHGFIVSRFTFVISTCKAQQHLIQQQIFL